VSVALERVDGRARLSVADHGPGLSEEQSARVFERFYRADTSRARASGGVGLGLSIVAAVTEAHGGTAEAKPRPGGGATFVVTLPLG
jgi:two-component system OmpR family sensor kinase